MSRPRHYPLDLEASTQHIRLFTPGAVYPGYLMSRTKNNTRKRPKVTGSGLLGKANHGHMYM